MGGLFGTDGVRDIANTGNMKPEMVLRLGEAFGFFLKESKERPVVVVGRDTRLSGFALVSALVSGLLSAGCNVVEAGVISTPGVSLLVRELKVDGGAVVSASHNPYEYNGVKFFNFLGEKLTPDAESHIEEVLGERRSLPTGFYLGKLDRIDPKEYYIPFLRKIAEGISLEGLKVVVDAANGALYEIAPLIFEELGASVIKVGCEPDGININAGVGATSPGELVSAVIREEAYIGFSFDGDGDRVLISDSRGNIADGDVILYLSASKLRPKAVVGTVMSNLGLEEVLASMKIGFIRVPVGDRWVYEEMKKRDLPIGGEPSGHVIFRPEVYTGDGLVTALKVLSFGESLEHYIDSFPRYPQRVWNVKVRDKGKVCSSMLVKEELQRISESWRKSLRIVLRPSGTEPLIRIMVEGKDPMLVETVGVRLAQIVKRADEGEA
ncbi:MAG: phosphoglucosamine mutase [Synergistetes bacterium]|nr:phosphoglucosamine mutase [Synergistota bacterium]